MLETPVVFAVFRRPEHTRKAFAAIAAAQPRRLFIIADGPRPEHPGDAERCAEVRQIVAQIDWDCEVERIYAEQNMGSGYRISSGLNQVFAQVERAIIIEDDCLVQPDFFRFCEEMLERYQDDERVMMVSGTNPLIQRHKQPYSYFFALPTICWGWATWRRAWQTYDIRLNSWPELRDTDWLDHHYAKPAFREYWKVRFERAYTTYGTPKMTFWDYQWFYTMWVQNGLSAFPEVNLVSNIGYGTEGTHTITNDTWRVYYASQPMRFPLRHPSYLLWDHEADKLRMEQITIEPPLYWRILMRFYRHVPVKVRKRIALVRSNVLQALGQRAAKPS